MQQLPVSVRTLWRRIALLRAVVAGAVAAGLVFLVTRDVSVTGLIWILPVAVFVLLAGVGIWWADARWKAWGFELTQRWITASHGVFQRRTSTVPRNRVQTVTTNNGPIDRYLNLTSIRVHTAGAAAPNLSIPHLEDSTVNWLRAELGQGVGGT